MLNFVKVALCISTLLLLLACSSENELDENAGAFRQLIINDGALQKRWLAYAAESFIEQGQQPDLESFASAMNSLNDATTQDRLSQYQQTVLRINSVENPDSAHKAKQALRLKQEAMLTSHLLTVCAQCFSDSLTHLNKSGNKSTTAQSLIALINSYPELEHGKIEAYFADNQTKVMAYSMTAKKMRAYVVFNFSFDLLEAPLPFGFMASTKVSVWRSDDLKLNTFVTQQALMISPFTAMIIIV